MEAAAFDAIIDGVRRGDQRAIEVLFRELQPRLLRFLRAQEPSVADDLAAEVWLAVARATAKFEGGWDDYRAWFFSIARRRLADHRRTAVRRRTDTVDAMVFELRPASDAPDEEALSRMSGQEAVALITSVLHGDQAEVLLLRVVADLDVERVAELMNRSPNWVRVTQHRAVRSLAKRLGSKVVVIR
jgi:RNA polymerase sigma-70 factor, ECF subfamily